MSLVAKTLSGMRWTTLAMATNVGFNLGYTAVMARLLAPAVFGLVAMTSPPAARPSCWVLGWPSCG